MENFLFYVFSTLMLLSAIKVIINQKPVESVLYLVIVFCNAAILIVLLEAEFMALLFIIVYVGAIAVLFLFVVIMLNVKEEKKKSQEAVSEYLQYLPFIFFTTLILYFEILLITNQELKKIGEASSEYVKWINVIDTNHTTNIELFGQVIYTYYVYYFLLCGIILLVALLATIALTLQVKVKGVEKKQKNFQQIARAPKNAIFIVR